MIRFFMFCFFANLVFAESVLLINDSPFPLTAIVQGADGVELGQVILQPGEQNLFDTTRTQLDMPSTPPASITPFTIVWKCMYKGFYSVGANVSPGSLIRANDCPGSRTCTPQPTERQQNEGCPCLKK